MFSVLFDTFPPNFFDLSSVNEETGPDTVLWQATQSGGLLVSKAYTI